MTAASRDGFRGQFVAGPHAVDDDVLTARSTFYGLHLSAHPGLSATRADEGETGVLILGTVLHPDRPGWTNQTVTQWLLDGLVTTGSLEEGLYDVGGRFVVLSHHDGRLMVHGDACGTRAVFAMPGTAGTWLASQPHLLETHAGARRDPDADQLLWDSPGADCWPGDLTPFPGVRMLLPNHRLDLADGIPERFWPLAPIEQRPTEETAQEMAAILKGLVEAVMRRGPVTVALTGGYDSRIALAAAWQARRTTKAITVVDLSTPSHDASIPARLALRTKIRLRYHWARPLPPSTHQRIRDLTGGVWRDPNQHRVAPFAAARGRTVLLAHASEITRPETWETPETVTPEYIAKSAGWGTCPDAIKAFRRWLDDVPDAGIDLLDLSYWESRVGVWGALSSLVFESYADPFTPFNCRRLQAVGLGAPLADRLPPWELQRRVVEILAPEIAKIPYNQTSFHWLKTRLPGPLRHVVHRARRRLAGASTVYKSPS